MRPKALEELEERRRNFTLTIGQHFELMRDAVGELYADMVRLQKAYGPSHRIAQAAASKYIQATEAVAVFRQEHLSELRGAEQEELG